MENQNPLKYLEKIQNLIAFFLNNDTMYTSEFTESYSIWIALTELFFENSGIVFYPGTQDQELLGDAGELNKNYLPKHFSTIFSNLNPGDVLIMNNTLWYESGKNSSGLDNVLLEINMKLINDII